MSLHFSGRFKWPAYSLDLNPLEYWFWGQFESLVFKKKPESLEEIKVMVGECAARFEKCMIEKSVNSILRRMEICLKNGGSHFEAEI